MALVGESGSGKTMVAQSIMSILPRIARIESGEILFLDPQAPGDVTDVSRLDPEGTPVRKIRGGRISIIFQEPMTALSPLHTIGNQIGESLLLHRTSLGKAERRDAVLEMLRLVGFADPGQGRAHLSVRALRRPAAAGDDRHGAGLPAGAAGRR